MKLLRRSTLRQRSWLMKTLWKELPPDILEKVLSYLPVPSLCRFRCVCKRWNTLISSPAFDALCARAPPRRYALVTSNECLDMDAEGWRVLDVASERFYTLENQYLVDHVEKVDGFGAPDVINPDAIDGFSVDTLAAAGGLFFVLCTGFVQGKQAFYVCHPVTQTLKELPLLDAGRFDHELGAVAMLADARSKTYRIFAMVEFLLGQPRMHVYDSAAGAGASWRRLCDPPDGLSPCSCAALDDGSEIYAVSSARREKRHVLLAYSVRDNEWRDAGVKLPKHATLPQLVTARGGRLYLVAAHRLARSQDPMRRLHIWELALARGKRAGVARMPDAWHNTLFPHDFASVWSGYNVWSRYDGDLRRPANLLAVGCEDSIFFFSRTGASVLYDLSTNAWRALQRPHAVEGPLYSDVGLYGCSTTLTLSFPL